MLLTARVIPRINYSENIGHPVDDAHFRYIMYGMSSKDRALAAIRDAEKALRELVAEAAATGDYQAVVDITGWAASISSILSGASEHRRSPPGFREQPRAEPVRRSPGVAVASAKPRRRRLSYPKFYRLRDELVKVGWSKRDRAEYVHKAPREVLNLLVEVISRIGAAGNQFSTDAMLPLVDSSTKLEVPAYQVYLCLAWLRQMGVVVQHGRQGYTTGGDGRIQSAVEQLWQELPRRSNQ